MSHFMNPQRGKHMGNHEPAFESKSNEEENDGGGESSDEKPQIHIHSHEKGHTVHVMHKDGRHEKHEHGHGDTEGVKQHIDKHLGDVGQDHGSPGEGSSEGFGLDTEI